MVTNIKLWRKDQIWEKSRVHFGNVFSSEVRAVLSRVMHVQVVIMSLSFEPCYPERTSRGLAVKGHR